MLPGRTRKDAGDAESAASADGTRSDIVDRYAQLIADLKTRGL
jgi:hypothetical protein